MIIQRSRLYTRLGYRCQVLILAHKMKSGMNFTEMASGMAMARTFTMAQDMALAAFKEAMKRKAALTTKPRPRRRFVSSYRMRSFFS